MAAYEPEGLVWCGQRHWIPRAVMIVFPRFKMLTAEQTSAHLHSPLQAPTVAIFGGLDAGWRLK
jgi:hypothetical protein